MLLSGILNVMAFSLSNGLKVISWFDVWPPGKTMRENKNCRKIKSYIIIILNKYTVEMDSHAEIRTEEGATLTGIPLSHQKKCLIDFSGDDATEAIVSPTLLNSVFKNTLPSQIRTLHTFKLECSLVNLLVYNSGLKINLIAT